MLDYSRADHKLSSGSSAVCVRLGCVVVPFRPLDNLRFIPVARGQEDIQCSEHLTYGNRYELLWKALPKSFKFPPAICILLDHLNVIQCATQGLVLLKRCLLPCALP